MSMYTDPFMEGDEFNPYDNFDASDKATGSDEHVGRGSEPLVGDRAATSESQPFHY